MLRQTDTVQNNRHYRDRHQLFYVEGIRGFVQAVDTGFTIKRILFSDKLLINPVARKLVRQQRRAGVATVNLSPEAFRRIATHKRASGVAALIQQQWHDLSATDANQSLCWTLLDSVRSPGNLGTLIRTSAAIGGAGFILVGNSVDPYAPSVLRSAMGASFHQAFVRTDWASLRTWIAERDRPVIGASPGGSVPLHALPQLATAPLLVLGEERQGLSRRQSDLCKTLVRIPMQPGADSLNLGVAGGLFLYEIRRQRAGP
ncbi:MAG: RNA methyltransferase [Pseudomonadota bacterium]